MKLKPRTKPISQFAAISRKHNQKTDHLGDIKYVHPDELQLRPNNPRQHSDEQIAKIASSVEQFGNLNPILIDQDKKIISGGGRLLAAKKMKLDRVPVLQISHLSDEEKRAYRIADNRLAELGEWDKEALIFELDAILEADEFSVELTGFSTAEIDTMQVEIGAEAASPATDPADMLPEIPLQPVATLGDIWRLGKHSLLCGSSLDGQNWKRLLKDDQASAVFTDPPYNVPIDGHVSGLGKHKHDDFAMASGEMSEDEFIAFNIHYLEAMLGYLKDGAVLALCMDWRHLFELQSAINRCALKQLNLCVWNKTNGGMGSLYRSQHELVVIAKKGRTPHTNNVQLGKYGRYRTNVWDYAGANSFGAGRDADLADHPTVKPVGLVADFIRDVTAHGELVLDAFMGSGTTILAAERTGRRAAGIEIDPRYVDVAIRRWQEMTGQDAMLSETGETFSEVSQQRRGASAAGPQKS